MNRTSKETGRLRHLPVFLFSEDCLAVVFREHLLDVGFPIEDFAAEHDIGLRSVRYSCKVRRLTFSRAITSLSVIYRSPPSGG